MRYILIFCLAALLNISCKKNTAPKETILPEHNPPSANAGNDTTIILPNTHVILDASKSFDPDNRPITYKWRKISGPEHISFSSSFYQKPIPMSVDINCYDAGEYLFELEVSNNIGVLAKDMVKITVVHSPFIEHKFDLIFDRNSSCKIEGSFPGNTYDEAKFRLYAESNGFSETAYIDQEYERSGTPYFYRATLAIANGDSGSVFLYFLSPQVFFTLPYNSGPAAFSDSVAVLYGVGTFANISKESRLHCTGIADTTNHTGKIILRGSLFY